MLGLISGVVLGEIMFDLPVKADAVHASGLAPAGERQTIIY